ncbi:MAG: FecCD family ABC transporter permease [Lactovum sp.]
MKFKFFLVLSILVCLIFLYLTHFSADFESLSLLILHFRLPRLLALMIAAFSLSLSGLLIQTLTRNPLADAGSLGIISGASAGAVTALALMPLVSQQITLPLFVILSALLTFSFLYFLAIKKKISNTKLLLLGLSLTALCQGYIMIIQLFINPFDVQKLIIWISGEVWQSSWITLFLAFLLLSFLIFILKGQSFSLEVLSLGDEFSVSLGLELEKTRRRMYLIAVILAIISVYLVGGLAFLGLIAPHISKNLIRFKINSLIFMTGLIGMIFLIASDLFAQLIIYPSSLPLGFVVAFIGAPYYIYLIQKDL